MNSNILPITIQKSNKHSATFEIFLCCFMLLTFSCQWQKSSMSHYLAIVPVKLAHYPPACLLWKNYG